MLYAGTNYHPHDWPEERWPEDIRLMKEAGFTVVRLGHLCWDSFEPQNGVYTFAWFDKVMDLMQDAGLKVFLDISMRPAPLWVHKACPGVNIVAASGATQAPLRRYMEDVADPDYQKYALRFAKTLMMRYRHHPALMAWGLCNELGDGYDSYSESSRQRFIQWLENRYGTLEALNHAWATQRWSRRIFDFQDVQFPIGELAQGQPEALLDMRRFFSDGITDFLSKLHALTQELSPDKPTSSNHYAEKINFGFDYQKICTTAIDFPGIGFYPGPSVGAFDRMNLLYYHHRLAETKKPMWCLEFQTGCKGLQHPPRGVNRMYHFLTLLYRSQMTLAWTWRSMLGGEEQFLYGLLDHDGTCSPNYQEFQKICQDTQKLAHYAFPYLPKPDIAVAYSQESFWQSHAAPWQYHRDHREAASLCTDALVQSNRDFNVVDLRHLTGHYRLLIVPAMSLMDEASADTIRQFVQKGGVCLMTAQSAQVNTYGQVFTSPMPGMLTDVFGIEVHGFERETSGTLSHEMHMQDRVVPLHVDLMEHLTLKGATCLAKTEFGDCILSQNAFGKGQAIYLAVPLTQDILCALLDLLAAPLHLTLPISTPDGVYARTIAPGQVLYVNSRPIPVQLQAPFDGMGVLRQAPCHGAFSLEPFDAELIVEESQYVSSL